MAKGKLFILSAPSGAGKSTVLSRVMAQLHGVAFSVSHTTRAPRIGEQDGREYHFVSKPEFTRMIDEKQFLEFAEVHGNFYGTSRLALKQQLDQGLDVILDIDVQGARIVRESGELPAVYVFLAPPNIAELERRLRERALDSEETIAKRLTNAHNEMLAVGEYEYLIVNDNLDEAVKMFAAVILAERARGHRDYGGFELQTKVFFS